MRNETTVGIDPGISGAIAVLYRGELAAVHDMPTCLVGGKKTRKRVDAKELHEILAEVDPDVICIENVGHVGNGGAFSFGHSCGVVQGVSAQWKTRLVLPKLWQAHHGIVKANKDESRAIACRMWPEWSDRFARVKDADRAEAALIAHWAWRQ